MNFRFNTKGIRFRLFIMGLAPTLLLVISLTAYFIEIQFRYLEQSLLERGNTIATQLAVASTYGVFSANKPMLQAMSDDLLNEKDVVYVSIKDLNGKVLAQSSHILESGNDSLQIFEADVKIQSLRKNSAAIDFSLFETEKQTDDRHIGFVQIGLSQKPIRLARHSFLTNSLTIIVACFVFALLLAFRLSKTISTPLINLTEVANDLANGNMDARAGKNSTTEIATLCESFNSMAIGLQQTQNYLIQQVNNAVKELTVAMESLEEKNQSLEKTTQMAIAQNETKSQFLAHISHEIRTPMNGIIGFIDLLTQSKLSPGQLEQARLIKTSAYGLLTIVNEILDYSSLETGNFKTKNISFDVRECIESSITAIVPRSRDVQIIIDIDTNLPTTVTSDPVRISQVLTNLVGNACKYTKQGHIVIRCILTRQSRLFVSVSDTGVGIAKNVIKDLFHPFLQISEYAVYKELGTGLGLTIAKNIIERLHGRIGVHSQLGKGSVFWFDIPVDAKEEEHSEIPGAMITVIDPMRLSRKALVKQLNRLGYTSRCFSAITQFRRQHENIREIILYAAGKTLVRDDDFHIELNRIGSFVGDAKVIFTTHQLHGSSTAEILPLPCRSSFLKQVITNALDDRATRSASDSSPDRDNAASHQFPVFIADDNEINRLLLKSQLESRSDDITLAEDGKQALALLRQRKYQLILLDLQMPHYNGLELLKIIKRTDCINHNTPVVAITAHAQSHQRKKLIDAGFDECLIKPVMSDQLNEVLNLWQPRLQPTHAYSSTDNDYLAQMLEKTSQNKQLAEVLFNKLFNELPGQVRMIQDALDDSEWDKANKIIHKLHGSVGFCGFSVLKEAAQRVEIDLSDGKFDKAKASFTDLQNKIDRFMEHKTDILLGLSTV